MKSNQDKGGSVSDLLGKEGELAVVPQANTTDTPAAPKYVTQQDLDAALNTFFDKRVQGFVDKRSNGLQNRVQSELANIKKALDLAGVEMSQEQQDQIRQRVINQAILEDQQQTASQDQTPQAPQADTQADGADPDPAISLALRLMDEAKVTIEDSDPEVKLINQDGTDTEFITSVMAAIAAKKERTSTEAAQTAARVTPGISQGGGTPGTYVGRKGLDLLSEAYTKR